MRSVQDAVSPLFILINSVRIDCCYRCQFFGAYLFLFFLTSLPLNEYMRMNLHFLDCHKIFVNVLTVTMGRCATQASSGPLLCVSKRLINHCDHSDEGFLIYILCVDQNGILRVISRNLGWSSRRKKGRAR